MNKPTISLDELADLIGRSPAWLRRHHLRMHREEGFPRRVPGTWVWPRSLAVAWLETGGANQSTTLQGESSPVTYVGRARHNLHKRYGIAS